MKEFQLPDFTKVVIRSLNIRSENHGNDAVPAADIGFYMTGSNKLLLMLDPGVFFGAYLPADGKETEPELDGVEPKSDRPKLRWTHVKNPMTFDNELVGRNLIIDFGTGGKSNLTLFGDANTFKAHLHDGGTVDIEWRFQVSGLDARMIGQLGAMLKHSVSLSMVASSVADGTQEKLPDTGAPKADPANPFKHTAGAKGGIVDNHPAKGPDATDIFAAGGDADKAARKALKDRAAGKPAAKKTATKPKPRTGKGN